MGTQETLTADFVTVQSRGAEIVLTVFPSHEDATTITLDPDYVDSLIGRLFTENRRARFAWERNKQIAAREQRHGDSAVRVRT